MPRPTKLTPDVQNVLISAIARGHTYESACQLARISFQTFRTWLKRGEAESKRLENPRTRKDTDPADQLYLEFFEEITRAEAQMIDDALTAIDAGAYGDKNRPGDWRAAAWKAERRKPDDWGQRQKITLEFNAKELAQLQQIKALLDKLNTPASDLFNDLIAELQAQETQERD